MRITAALKQFKLIDVMLHIAINRFLENIIEKSYNENSEDTPHDKFKDREEMKKEISTLLQNKYFII